MRRDRQQSDERAPHHVDATESGCRGHLLQASIRPFEQTPRCLHAHLQHVLGRRRAHLSGEHTLEVRITTMIRRLEEWWRSRGVLEEEGMPPALCGRLDVLASR